MDFITAAQFQAFKDQATATHLRTLAELIVLRRFLAQLYHNCSGGKHSRVATLDLMETAADQLEQKLMEDLEATQPGLAARIDGDRPGTDSSAVLPPAW